MLMISEGMEKRTSKGLARTECPTSLIILLLIQLLVNEMDSNVTFDLVIGPLVDLRAHFFLNFFLHCKLCD